MGDGDTSAVLAIATALTSRLAAALRKVAQDRLRRSAAGVKARLKPAIRSAAPGLAWMARASAGTLYPMPYLSVMDRRRPGCAGTGRRRPPPKIMKESKTGVSPFCGIWHHRTKDPT
jgi:hypothetical protein